MPIPGAGAILGIRLIPICLLLWLSPEALYAADTVNKRNSFDITALPLEQALLIFSEQSGVQISAQTSDLSAITSHAIKGRYRAYIALQRLLENVDLSFAVIDDLTIVVGHDLQSYSQLGHKIYRPYTTTAQTPDTVRKQEAIEASNEAPTNTIYIEDVVVTALRRPQNQKDVPVHFQVIPNIVLQDIHLTRLEELSFALPTVTFTQRRGYDQSTFRIRGMGTQVLGAGVEPSVATMIDGVVMARGGAMLNELQDIERIEILNGPQGTLFGKNASAGLLNIITQKPNHQDALGYIDGRITSDEEYGLRLGLTGPITSKLAFRLSGYVSLWDGNAENVTTGNTVNGVHAYGIRTKLSLLTDKGHDFLLSADFSSQDTECCARITRSDILGLTVDPSFINDTRPAGLTKDILGIPISETSNQIAHNRDPRQDSTNYGVSLEANFSVGAHTLTSISAYRVWTSRNGWDNDLLPVNFHRQQQSNRDANWFTQELRLTSPQNERFDYLVGLYYFNSNTDALEYTDRNWVNLNIDEIVFVDSTISQENAALFGHFNFRPTDRLTLFGGARFLFDTVSATAMRGGRDLAADGSLVFDYTTPTVSNSETDAILVGRTGVQYAITEQANLYVSYGRGYKGRGFGVEFGFDPVKFVTDEPVAPEITDSYEIGLKGIYFDRRLQLDITGYYNKVSDLQLGLRDLNTIANILGTVPKTTVKGIELSFMALPTEGLNLSGGIAYNRAVFADFPLGLCYLGQTSAQGCVNGAQDLTGHVLENAPKWKAVLNVRYERQMGANLFGFLQTSMRVQSGVFLSDDADPRSWQRGYGIIDASLGIFTHDERTKLSLFAKNVTNQKYVAGVSANSADGGGVLVHTLPRDFHRYFGLSVSFKL